jgi:UDP-GlcNAc:undecaprenyl-phosphate GlcNAc-1-phosphate transferase
MTIILIFISLFLLIRLYFILANRYNIIDKPNQRSSHTSVTLRGGGVIFPISLILWFFLNDFQYPFLTLGVFLIATISFLDDILSLSSKSRLLVHLISVLLVLYELAFLELEWWTWIIGVILLIGWLNTFNFMDGINGITVLYAASVLAPLAMLNYELSLIDQSLYYYLGSSLIVFGFYNVRKKAKTFAGDVGSISLGLIVAFLLISLILNTGNWEYILFVSVYGIDSVITIIERLLKRENIFEAHRSHLYQLLANEIKIPHILVSLIYAIIQFVIAIIVIYHFPDFISAKAMIIVTLALLSLIYIVLKRKISKLIAT